MVSSESQDTISEDDGVSSRREDEELRQYLWCALFRSYVCVSVSFPDLITPCICIRIIYVRARACAMLLSLLVQICHDIVWPELGSTINFN